MSDIELVTDEEIVAELARRHACVVLLVSDDVTPTQETGRVWYRGGRYRAMGLMWEQLRGVAEMPDDGVPPG